MKNNNHTITILVDQTPTEVFNAVNNVRGWWSKGIKGDTTHLNDEFIFEVKGVHYSRQKLVEFIPGKKVAWLITESNIQFVEDTNEWTGTKVIFEIDKKENQTRLVFTHEGLVPGVACYESCAPAWTAYIQHSLYNLITTGKGDPNLEGKRIMPVTQG